MSIDIRGGRVMKTRRLIVCVGAVVTTLGFGVGTSGAANNSEQVVFSIRPSFLPGVGPLGFWIWCEADSSNPYQGACNGSIYLYESSRVESVGGHSTINEPTDGIYTISVVTSDINCSLTNETPDAKGSHQVIDVTCNSASGQVTGTVNITGP